MSRDKEEIVKVQLALESSHEKMILVYNEDRSRQCFIPQTEQHVEEFNGELKSFWYAQWNYKKEGYDLFTTPAPWQSW